MKKLGLALLLVTASVPTAHAYYDDVHYALTYYIARRVGFTPEQAYRIASATVSVDYHSRTEPVQPGPQGALYFTPYERRAIWPRVMFHAMHDTLRFDDPLKGGSDADKAQAAVVAQRERLWQLAVDQVRNPGVFLHFLQDETPHRGYGAAWGHWPVVPESFPQHIARSLAVGGSTDWIAYRDTATGIDRVADTRFVAEQTAERLARFLEIVSPRQAFERYRPDEREIAAVVRELALANPAPRPLDTDLLRQAFVYYKLQREEWVIPNHSLPDLAKLEGQLKAGRTTADLDAHFNGPSLFAAIDVINSALDRAGMRDRLSAAFFKYDMEPFTQGVSDDLRDRGSDFAGRVAEAVADPLRATADAEARQLDKWVLVGDLEVAVLREKSGRREPLERGRVAVKLAKLHRADTEHALGDPLDLAPGAPPVFEKMPVGELIVEVRGMDGVLLARQEGVQLTQRRQRVEVVVPAEPERAATGLEGTWTITGVRRGAWAGPLPNGTMTLRLAGEGVVKEGIARPWGGAANWPCEQRAPAAKAYIGTLQWDKGSFFEADPFCWYRARGAAASGAILLCEASNGAVVMGRFRDDQNMRGGGLDLRVGEPITGTLTQDCNGPTSFAVTVARGGAAASAFAAPAAAEPTSQPPAPSPTPRDESRGSGLFAGGLASPTTATPPASAPAPRAPFAPAGPAETPRAGAADAAVDFVGFDEDRVGPGNAPRPDGGPDGHFRLRLDRGGEIRAIVLADAAPGSSRGEWSTAPGTHWLLGVRAGGAMLNAFGQKPSLGPLPAGAELDLFASNYNTFHPGNEFKVEVRFADGTTTTSLITLGQAGGRARPSDLAWVGLDDDRVGAGNSPRPSGTPDGHFRLGLPQGVEIRSLKLFTSNLLGAPEGGHVWSTAEGSYWLLGVAQGAGLLNARGQGPTLGRFEAGQQLDLYAENAGSFRDGQYLTLEVETTTGTMTQATARVAGVK